MSDSEFIIRAAMLEDAEEIGKVHVDAWRTTYRGILTDAFLAELNSESRAESARIRIQNPNFDNLTALDKKSGRIVGFAAAGKSREKNLSAEGELYAIYLLKDYQGKGIGSDLFQAAKMKIKIRFKDFFVSVFTENNGAVAFYKKMGGLMIGNDHVDVESVRHKTDTYFWELN